MGSRKRSLIGLLVCMLLCMQFTVPVFANGSSKKVVRFVTSWNESKGLGGKFKIKDGMDFPLSNEMVSTSYMVIVDGGKSESIAVWDVTYASKSSKISAFPEVTSCGSDKLVGWVDENGNEVDERHSVKSDSVYYAVYKQGVTYQEDVGFASGSGSGSGQKPGSSDGSGSVKPNKDKPGSGSVNSNNNSGSGNGSGNVGNDSGNAGLNSGGNSNGVGNTGGSDKVNGSTGNNSGSQGSDGISGNESEPENVGINGSGSGTNGMNSGSSSDNVDGGNLESGGSANGSDKNGSGSNSTGNNSGDTGNTSGSESSNGNTDTFTITSYLFHVKELKGNIRDIRLQSNKSLKDLAEVLSFDADSYAVKQVDGDEYSVKDDMTLEELIDLLTNGDVCLIGYKDKKPIGCAVFCDSLSENEFNLVMSKDTDVKLRTADEVVNGVKGVDEGMADILNASKGSNVVRGLLIAGVVIVLLVGFLVWAFFSKKKKK